MSLNASDEGKRRGKDRADFERAYAEAYKGVNTGDTPGSGIRGSGGLSPKPSIDLTTTDPRYFSGGRDKLHREPKRDVQEIMDGTSQSTSSNRVAERAAAQDASAESILRQRFPGGVIDTLAKSREAQQAAVSSPAPAQLDPMASLKAPLQVAPGTFDPKATGENPFPATQAAIPSAKAPAAASITAIPSAPAPVAAPAPAVKPYELTYQKADGSFYGETREGKGQTFKTQAEATQFSNGTALPAAPAQAPQVAASHPDGENPATDRETTSEKGEQAGQSPVVATPSPDTAASPSAWAAGMAPVTSIKGLGQRAGKGLDFLASNPTAANPAMAANTIARVGGALVNGLWDGDYKVPEKGIFRQVGEALADAIYSPPTSLPALPKPAAPQVMAFDAPGNPVSAANVPNNVVQSPVSAAPAAPQVMAFNAPGNPVSAAPAPVINAGPDPVQPMAPQSVANMDVPTLFKRPGGVRGQSRTSVIKPTPFYQL